METERFYEQVREVVGWIAADSLRLYDLQRSPPDGNPHEAARLARASFERFKAAQETLLETRLAVEAQHQGARTPANPDPAPFSYRLSVLSDLQNTMLWALMGDDSATANLSASIDVDFGYLRDRNIESVVATAREINQDPNSFAIIADLGTGVAIGDLLQFTVTDEPRLQLALIEVKEGVVNAAILSIHELFERDDPEFEPALNVFLDRYGERGMKQLERFGRQLQRATTWHKLIGTGRARDFVRDATRFIQTVPAPESYAPLFNEILADFWAHDRRYASFTIDHLYFGFYANDEAGPRPKQWDFQHEIYHRVLGNAGATCCFGDDPERTPFEVEFKSYIPIPVSDLRAALQMPFLPPLALTGLKPEYVADILAERLFIWIFVAEQVMIDAFRAAGLNVRLTRRGHPGSDERSMYRIDGQYIEIEVDDPHLKSLRLGAKPVLRTMFSLQTLGSLITQMKAPLPDMRTLAEKKGDDVGP